MLTGSDLLAKVKELSGASKSELARACGYITTDKQGKAHIAFSRFQEALLAANGISLSPKPSRRGRTLTNETRVHFNGNLLVGRAYTEQANINPGDVYSIKIQSNGNKITLERISRSGDTAQPQITSAPATMTAVPTSELVAA